MMQPVEISTIATTPVAAEQANRGEHQSDQKTTSDAAKLSLYQDKAVAGSSMLAVGFAKLLSDSNPDQQVRAKSIDGLAAIQGLTSTSVASAISNIEEVATGKAATSIEENKQVDNGINNTNNSVIRNNNPEELMQLLQAAKDENELLEFKNYELLFKIQELEQAQQRNLNICPNYKHQQQVGSYCFDGFHEDSSRQKNRQQEHSVTTTAVNNEYLPSVPDGSGLQENDRRRRTAAAAAAAAKATAATAGRRPANESDRSQAPELRPEAAGERELCPAMTMAATSARTGNSNSHNNNSNSNNNRDDGAAEDDWATARAYLPGESRRPTRPQAAEAATTNLDHHEIDYSLPHHSHLQSPYNSDCSASIDARTGEPRRRSKSVGLIESADDYERHNETGERMLSHLLLDHAHLAYNSDEYDSDECASVRTATADIANCCNQVPLESECEQVTDSDRLELIFSNSVENCRSSHIGGDIMKRTPASAGSRSVSRQVRPVESASKKTPASKSKLLSGGNQQQQQVSTSLAKSQPNLATSLSTGMASETTAMKPRAARIAMPVQRPGKLQQTGNRQVGMAKISSATTTGACLMASRARSKSSLDASALIKDRTSVAAATTTTTTTRKQATPKGVSCAVKEQPSPAPEAASSNSSNFVTQIPTLISQSHAQQQTGLALAATGIKSNGESYSPRQIADRSATAAVSSSSMGSIRAQQQSASSSSSYKCRGPVKKSMDKIASVGQQQTSVQRPSQVREQQQNLARRREPTAGRLQVTGAASHSSKLASSKSLTSLFVAPSKTRSNSIGGSTTVKEEATDESELSCGKQQQVASVKAYTKQRPGEQIDGSPLCKSDAAAASAATTSGEGCKVVEDGDENNKSAAADDEKSEDGTGNLLAVEKRAVSFANLHSFCVQSDADDDDDDADDDDDGGGVDGDEEGEEEGEDDQKDAELDGNECCAEGKDGQVQQVDAQNELVAAAALGGRAPATTATSIKPTNQCSKSLSEINAIADCVQVGPTCSSQQQLQQQQQLACGQCKLLHAKLSLLLKDRKQLNEQLNELEEMENDSRLLSQKLTKKLTSLEQQLELTQNDLALACESESKLRFQNKQLHFELKERCDRIARLHAHLCSLSPKSSASSSAGRPGIGSDTELHQANNNKSQQTAAINGTSNNSSRPTGDVQANNDETNEAVAMDSTTTSGSSSDNERTRLAASDADESCASSSTGAQVRGDDSAYSKSSSSSSSSHNGDSDVDEHNTAQQTPTDDPTTSPVDESVKGEAPDGDIDIAGGGAGKDEPAPVLAARQQVHRKRISTARILRGSGSNYTCDVMTGQQSSGGTSSASITLAKAHVVSVAPSERALQSAQLTTSCRQMGSADETAINLVADDKSALELTLKGVAELESGSSEPLRRLVADQIAALDSNIDNNNNEGGSQVQTSIADSGKQQQQRMNDDHRQQRAAGGDGRQKQVQVHERRQMAAVDKQVCNLKDEIANLRTRLLQVQTLNDNLVEELRNKNNQARKSSPIAQAQTCATGTYPCGRRSSVILINSQSSSSLEAAVTTTQTTSATVRCTINGSNNGGTGSEMSQQVWQPRTVVICNGPDGTSNTVAASPMVVEPNGGSGSARYAHNNDLIQPTTGKGDPSSVQQQQQQQQLQQQQQWRRQQLEDVAHFLRSLLDKIHFHHGRTFELASECQRVAMSALLVGTCESGNGSSGRTGQHQSRLASLVHHNNVVMAGSKATIQRQLVDTSAACNVTQPVTATSMQQYPVMPPPRRRNNIGRNSTDGTCSGHDSSEQHQLSSNVSNCAATASTGSMTMNQTNGWQPIVANGFNNNKNGSSSNNNNKNGHSPNANVPENQQQQQQHQKQTALQVAKQTLFSLVPIYGSAGSNNGRSVNDGSGKNPGASGYSVDGSKNKKHSNQINSQTYNNSNCMSAGNGATGSSSLMCSDNPRAQSVATTTMTTTDDHSFNLNSTNKQTYTNVNNANYCSDYKGNRRQLSCNDQLAAADSAVSKLEILSHHQTSVNVVATTTANDLPASRPMSLNTINLNSTHASDTVHVDIKWKRQPLVHHNNRQQQPHLQLTDSPDLSLHVLPISDHQHQQRQQQQQSTKPQSSSLQGEDIERLRVHLNGQLLDLVTRQNWCESLIMDKLKAIEQIIASGSDLVVKSSTTITKSPSATPQQTSGRPLPSLPVVQSLRSQQQQKWCSPVVHDADHSYATASTKTTNLTQSTNAATANNYTNPSNHYEFANDNNGSFC